MDNKIEYTISVAVSLTLITILIGPVRAQTEGLNSDVISIKAQLVHTDEVANTNYRVTDTVFNFSSNHIDNYSFQPEIFRIDESSMLFTGLLKIENSHDPNIKNTTLAPVYISLTVNNIQQNKALNETKYISEEGFINVGKSTWPRIHAEAVLVNGIGNLTITG
jgi:hypothetical protein